jgi:putative ATPase
MTKRRAPETQGTLLEAAAQRGSLDAPPAPLAQRMRPERLDDLVGQEPLLAENGALRRAIESDRVPSMILWGPPGSGKTSIAHVVSRRTRMHFEPFSAVLGGVAELRKIIDAARERRRFEGRGTILFVDEIHRFNKAQQDAFLPHVENGTVTLIGATTENPSFAVNAAVLSRARVFRLEPLSEAAITSLLGRALGDARHGLGPLKLSAEPGVLEAIARSADGDARRALNLLESAGAMLAEERSGDEPLTLALVARAAEERTLLYDKAGEEHYNVISAFIKSMRGSDPDAAVYWLMRMLESGDDPLFILRRMIIFASEDIGNTDPDALGVAVNADLAFRRVGMPEGIFPLAHACVYLACAPKSNAVYRAFTAAKASIAERGALPVPLKLRNAVTGLMRDHGYGESYRYAHDFSEGHVQGETYLPDALVEQRFYEPSEHGFERTLKERLEAWRRGR